MNQEFSAYLEIVEDLLLPLIEASEDFDIAENLLRDLGYAPPSQVLAFQELNGAINAIIGLIESLRSTMEGDDNEQLLQQFAQLIPEVGRAIQAINSFHQKIQTNFAGSPF